MQLVRSLQKAQGVGICGGKNGGVVNGLGEQLLGHLIAIFDRGTGILAVEKPLLESHLLTGADIPFRPQLMRGGVAAAKVQNIPMPQGIEVFHPKKGAKTIVHGYITLGLVPQVL